MTRLRMLPSPLLLSPLALGMATLAAGAFATTAQAQDAPTPLVVYELFTSQGCSSCPPANAQITRLSDKPGTLALSYGVTYWDYLGWEDTFATPAFTQRQHDYVRALGARNAYTPQIVVNGTEHGPRLRGDLERIATPVGTQVTLREDGGRVVAEGPGQAVLVAFTPGTQEVPVARGENGGRTLPITNVVTDVERVELPHSFSPEAGTSYALLQHGEDAKVTSAARWPE